MTLLKWVRDDLKKYSFIKSTNFVKGMYYLYYEVNGKIKFKKIPYRADKRKLINVVEKIREEINYYEKRKEWAIKINKEIQEEMNKPSCFFCTWRANGST